MRYRRSTDVVKSDLGDEAVLLSLKDGEYHGLNSVAAFIWDLLEDGRTAAEMQTAVCAEFDVGDAAVDADITALLAVLVSRGLIVEVDL